MVSLDIYDGSRRRTVDIDAGQIRVGRDRDCELLLPADPTVSRQHAVMRTDGETWVIEDLASRNGTYVNGERILAPVEVSPTDRVLIGTYVIVVRGDEDMGETVGAVDGDPGRAAAETGLSRREIDVLRLVCAGRSDQEIADALVISVKTVHSHLDRIRDKTGARRRAELQRFGMSHGIA